MEVCVYIDQNYSERVSSRSGALWLKRSAANTVCG
jgi:hypothetical protein